MEEVLNEIGEFGSYQKSLVWLICLPPLLLAVFPGFVQIFMIVAPKYYCQWDKLLDVRNSSAKYYNVSHSEQNLINLTLLGKCSETYKNVTTLSTKELFKLDNHSCCPFSWTYDDSDFNSTIVSEWDLIKSKEILLYISMIILNLAGLTGLFAFGKLEERYGKKSVYLICICIQIIFGISTAYAPNIFVFLICRFFVGLTFPAIVRILYVIALEWIGKSKHALVLTVFNIAYCTGYLIMLLLVYYLRIWRDIAFATAVPFVIFFLYWWFLPESPSWLVRHDHQETALNLLIKIAKLNGKVINSTYMENLKEKMMKIKRHPSDCCRRNSLFEEMFRMHKAYKVPLYTLIWFANGLLYYSITWYLLSLGNNIFLSFALGIIVEFPVYGLVKIAMTLRSRRLAICISMVICGLLCLFILLIPTVYLWVIVIITLIGKFYITASFTILLQFSGDTFPNVPTKITPDYGPIMAQIGVIVTPLVLYLSKHGVTLPFAVLGSVCLLGGTAALAMSENIKSYFLSKVEKKFSVSSNRSNESHKDSLKSPERVEMLSQEQNGNVVVFEDGERSETPDSNEISKEEEEKSEEIVLEEETGI